VAISNTSQDRKLFKVTWLVKKSAAPFFISYLFVLFGIAPK